MSGRFADAVRLAGLLAERGEERVELRVPEGMVRVLTVRETDLPGELERAAAGTVVVGMATGVRARVALDGVVIESRGG